MNVKDITLSNIRLPEVIIRSVADEERIEELVVSIREQGLLQPIVVRPEDDHYKLIAGWRRLVAVDRLGRETIPCHIVDVGALQGALMLLTENAAREDVNPIDEAEYFRYLIVTFGMSHEEIADKIGKQRTYVSSRLRLLDLDPDTSASVITGDITPTHALQLKRIEDPGVRKFYRDVVIKDGANTATLRRWVNDVVAQPPPTDVGHLPTDVVKDDHVPRYKAPACFICGVSIDEKLLKNVWVCYGDLEVIERSVKEEP